MKPLNINTKYKVGSEPSHASLITWNSSHGTYIHARNGNNENGLVIPTTTLADILNDHPDYEVTHTPPSRPVYEGDILCYKGEPRTTRKVVSPEPDACGRIVTSYIQDDSELMYAVTSLASLNHFDGTEIAR